MRIKFTFIYYFISIKFYLSFTLYEDQIGTFDWFFFNWLKKKLIFLRYSKHIGCFTQTIFDLTETGEKYLIAASDKNAIAKINIKTGNLGMFLFNFKSFYKENEIFF